MTLTLISTEKIHTDLKKIAAAHTCLMQGTFTGMNFLMVKDAAEYLTELHDIHMKEFRSREDAIKYEPNINKIGTAELV